MILTILYIVAALDAFSFSMTITVMAPYVYSLGGSQFFMGVLGSVCAFVTLVWNPIVGSLSDRQGRKKVLLQLLFICFFGNFIVTCYSSLTIWFISRVIAALGTQIMTLLKSLIDDNIQSKDAKMAAINKIQALGGFCFIFGALVAGHLSEMENGYRNIFYLISAMFAINFGLISLLKENKKSQDDKKKVEKTGFNIFGEIKMAAKNLANVDWPRYWDIFVIKLIIDFALNVFQFNCALILTQRFGISGKSFGYVFAAMSVITITTSLAMMKVKSMLYTDDESGLKRLLHGNILLILSFLGLGLGGDLGVFMLFLVILSVARVMLETTLTEVLLARASPEEKGGIMGTFDSTISLGGLVAPLLSGWLADAWGESMCLLFCIFPLAIGTVLTYSQKNKMA